MESSLQRHPIFGRSAPAVRAQLLSSSRVLSLPPRARVLSEGDVAKSIFALERGAVRVFHQSTGGDEVSLKLFRAPVVFGEAEALYGVPFQENVETIEDCHLIEMPTAAVKEFLAAAPLAAIAFVEDLSARLAIASYHQRSLAFHPITIRLANFLLDYAEWTNDPGVHEWSLALSQDDMAAAIGAARRAAPQRRARRSALRCRAATRACRSARSATRAPPPVRMVALPAPARRHRRASKRRAERGRAKQRVAWWAPDRVGDYSSIRRNSILRLRPRPLSSLLGATGCALP